MKSDNRTLPVIVFFHLQHGWEIKWNKYVEGITEGCLDASSTLAISTILKTTGATVVFCFRTKCFGENWWTKQVCPQQAIFSVQAQKITCTRVLSQVHAVIFAISTKQKQSEHTSVRIFCLALLFLNFSLLFFHSLLIRLCFEWGTKKEKWKALTKFDYIWLYIIFII